MAEQPVTAVIVDDHNVVAAGVRAWCAQADPRIELIEAGASLLHVWTGQGGQADVVIFDLLLAGSPGTHQIRQRGPVRIKQVRPGRTRARGRSHHTGRAHS